MIQPTREATDDMAKIARGARYFMEWLKNCRQVELERLPATLNQTAVAQGRCQVLGELVQLLESAPDDAA